MIFLFGIYAVGVDGIRIRIRNRIHRRRYPIAAVDFGTCFCRTSENSRKYRFHILISIAIIAAVINHQLLCQRHVGCNTGTVFISLDQSGVHTVDQFQLIS